MAEFFLPGTTSRNLQKPDVNVGSKRATSLLSSFGSNVAKQDARFLPVLP